MVKSLRSRVPLMTDPTPWLSGAALLISAVAGIYVALSNRKSQAEANQLNGTGQLLTQQNTFLQDVQEEKNAAVAALKDERETNKALIDALTAKFESFKKSVDEEFSDYRTYIYGLHGQIRELGGVPLEWPTKLRK